MRVTFQCKQDEFEYFAYKFDQWSDSDIVLSDLDNWVHQLHERNRIESPTFYINDFDGVPHCLIKDGQLLPDFWLFLKLWQDSETDGAARAAVDLASGNIDTAANLLKRHIGYFDYDYAFACILIDEPMHATQTDIDGVVANWFELGGLEHNGHYFGEVSQ